MIQKLDSPLSDSPDKRRIPLEVAVGISMKNYQQESSTVMSWLAGGWHGVKCGYMVVALQRSVLSVHNGTIYTAVITSNECNAVKWFFTPMKGRLTKHPHP